MHAKHVVTVTKSQSGVPKPKDCSEILDAVLTHGLANKRHQKNQKFKSAFHIALYCACL